MLLLPSSLFGRLVLVLLVGLLLAQLLSILILFQDRGHQMYKAQERYLAQRIVEVVQVLDSFAPSQREQIVTVLNTLRLRVFLSDATSLLGKCVPNKSSSPIWVPVQEILRHHFGADRQLCLTEMEVPPSHSAMVSIGLQTPLHPPFLVNVQLQDGNWVSFEHLHLEHEDFLARPWRLFIMLAVLLIMVLVLSLLAVHWITRPLAILAQAAERLGRNIHHPPLAEQGPTELQRAARAFNTMQTRLTRHLEDRARILIAVSHDLKTPITRLRLRVEQLDDPQLRQSFLKDIEEMQTMTAGTLDFMRGLENQEQVQPLDIYALLESLQADYEDMGQHFQIDGEVPPPCLVRPQSLKRCLVNLLDNAFKYAQQITVILNKSFNKLDIFIIDEGPGIPEAALETVFEPFYRLETSRSRSTGGTGLGLSIARNIARAHGGDIVLRNRPQGGLEAVLSLPCSSSG